MAACSSTAAPDNQAGAGSSNASGGAMPSGGGSGNGGAAQSSSGGTSAVNGGSANAQGGISAAQGGSPSAQGGANGGSTNAQGGISVAQGGSSASNGGSMNGNAGSGTGGGAAGASNTGGASNSTLSVAPLEGVYSYPRTTANGPTQSFKVTNSGPSIASFSLELAGSTPGAFRITAPSSVGNVMLAPHADLQVSVQFVPNGSGVPAAPPADSGGVAVNARLVVQASGASAQANLFGLVMTAAGDGAGAEPTLGQILTTLGYAVDVGTGLRDHLANSTNASAQGSEVMLPRFVRASAEAVTLRVVARFSPSGPMPFGYYSAAAPNCANAASYTANCHVVGTMGTNSDANTSNGSRMLNPPSSSASATFDPGSAPFGIWSYTDQASQKVSTGGSAANGDYAYSDNALNSPANMHRVRVWPLRDRAGNAVSNSYLLGFEEASNGDYQDYVFVLSNVKAP